MSNFIISCCSTADLSHEWYDRREIYTVPFHISVGGTEYEDDIGVTITQEQLFEKMLAGEEAHSSQVNVEAYVAHFEPFLKEGKDILHITLSSGISGSINSARVAQTELQEKYPERKLIIVDSLNGSSGYGMIVDTAADMRDDGSSIEEIQKWIEDNIHTFHTWILSTDLTFLIKGGRVKPVAGAIGKMLNICPIVSFMRNGELTVMEKVRTKKKAISRMSDIMKENTLEGIEYAGKCFISHSDEELANEMKEKIESEFPHLKGNIKTFLVGGTIGVHLGPGTVVLFFTGKERG